MLVKRQVFSVQLPTRRQFNLFKSILFILKLLHWFNTNCWWHLISIWLMQHLQLPNCILQNSNYYVGHWYPILFNSISWMHWYPIIAELQFSGMQYTFQMHIMICQLIILYIWLFTFNCLHLIIVGARVFPGRTQLPSQPSIATHSDRAFWSVLESVSGVCLAIGSFVKVTLNASNPVIASCILSISLVILSIFSCCSACGLCDCE